MTAWPPLGVSALNATLDESWDSLPGRQVVDDWLKEAGIWDNGLSVVQRDERWVRFQGCDFGVAPPGKWPRMRRPLLEFEPKLAVRKFPFELELTTEKGVLHRATPLPPAKRMWVRRHLAELEEQGVIERVASAKFASNIVLVDDGQSG